MLLYRSGQFAEADRALIAAGASIHDTVYGEELLLDAVSRPPPGMMRDVAAFC
jgi:hypothetical protein